MIQLIGFMIAAYIATRMIELLNNKETSGVIATFAAVTLLVTAISVFGLISSGSQLSSLLSH